MLNQKETTSVEENTTEVVSSVPETKTNLTIDYKKAKEKLHNFGYSTFLQLVDFVETNTNGNLKKEANKVLKDILQTNDIEKMSELALKLQGIVSKYKRKKEEVKKKVKSDIDIINKISIDGTATVGDIKNDIDSYINGLDLKQEKKKILKDLLLEKVNDYSEAKEIGLKEIDSFFNELANKLKKRADGKYELTISSASGSETLIFKDKEEAIKVLSEMKSKAEYNFQSWIRTGLEGITNFYINSTIGLLKKFKDSEIFAFNYVKENFNNSDTVAWASMLLLGIPLGIPVATFMAGSLFYFPHSGVVESIVRRTQDPFINNSAEKQMKDYLRITTNFTELDTDEAKEYIEVKQRGLIIDLLKEKLNIDYEKGTKEYEKFKENIKITEKYRLNRGPTFYYLANKLVNNVDLGIKSNLGKGIFYNLHSTFLKGAKLYYPTPKFQKKLKAPIKIGINKWEYEPSQQIARKILDKLEEGNIDKLNEGLKLFFKNQKVEIERPDKEPVKIIYKLEGDDILNDRKNIYNKFISYIKSKDISNKKKESLIKKFDEYINILGNNAKSKETIYKDLYFLLETDFNTKEELSEIVQEKIKKLKKKKNKYIKFGEKVIDKVSFGKIQSELIKLEKLDSLINFGEWIGTKSELEDYIENIKNGEKVKGNYEGKTNGINFEDKFLEMKSKAEIFFDINKDIKEHIFKSETFDFENIEDLDSKLKTEELQNIQNTVDYLLSDDIEIIAEENLNRLLKDIIEQKISLNNLDDFYIEVEKILRGDLIKSQVIDQISEIKKGKLTQIAKNKLEVLERLVKEGYSSGEKFSINKQELSRIIKIIKSGNNIDTIDFESFKFTPNISDIKNEINGAKNLEKYDYKKLLKVDTSSSINDSVEIKKSLLIKYKNEINYLNILNEINGDNFDIKHELGELAIKLEENNYTKGQINKILEELFINKKELKDIDFNSIIEDRSNIIDHSKEFNKKTFLHDLLKEEFNKLDNEKQKEIIDSIRKTLSEGEQKELPLDIKNELFSGDKEKLLKTQKNILEKKINELEESEEIDKIEKIKENFDKYIEENQIDPFSESFTTLIKEFELRYLKKTNIEKYKKRINEARIKLKLYKILNGGSSSDVQINNINDIIRAELTPEIDNILDTFIEKAKEVDGLESINLEQVKQELIDKENNRKITEELERSGRTELKEFWKRVKRLRIELFKEIRKGRI